MSTHKDVFLFFPLATTLITRGFNLFHKQWLLGVPSTQALTQRCSVAINSHSMQPSWLGIVFSGVTDDRKIKEAHICRVWSVERTTSPDIQEKLWVPPYTSLGMVLPLGIRM